MLIGGLLYSVLLFFEKQLLEAREGMILVPQHNALTLGMLANSYTFHGLLLDVLYIYLILYTVIQNGRS